MNNKYMSKISEYNYLTTKLIDSIDKYLKMDSNEIADLEKKGILFKFSGWRGEENNMTRSQIESAVLDRIGSFGKDPSQAQVVTVKTLNTDVLIAVAENLGLKVR